MSLSIAMLSPNIDRIGGAAASKGIGGAPNVSSGAAPQSDFAQTLASMAADAIGTVKTGETTAIAGMQGKAPLQQVVQAVMQADQALRTVVAVRDKVVGAYQEISRMQI
ncbi:flagellar hook-basal body complex protein FliE [Hyphomicrobium sp. ghe19]|uniref:flagellar hook-basal body complex protein FliE n=1 Tax=Hyphomicrobium sp. ghe19 TaxID=2682968 RepID=UPI0013671142|nr:Flagellar hook-basal body complex protein FliE [Hyphomicrobium sp. ghe19]